MINYKYINLKENYFSWILEKQHMILLQKKIDIYNDFPFTGSLYFTPYWTYFSCFAIYESKSVCHSVESNSVTPWTVAHQDPLSMKFSRQESSSGLPFSSPEDVSDPRIESESPILQAESILSEPPRNIFFFVFYSLWIKPKCNNLSSTISL